MSMNPNLNDAVDKLAETSSYHEARRLLGLPQPDPAFFTADAIEKRLAANAARNAAQEANQELYHLTGPIELTRDQIAVNEIGIAACRAAVTKPKQQP